MKLITTTVIVLTYFKYAETQFLFGHPQLFITSNDTDATYDPFQLIHDGNRFYKLAEYVQFGISDTTRFHIVYVDTTKLLDFTIALTVNDMREATIKQNLEKELFFAHYNSSGVFPQMRVINTTFVSIIPFHANYDYPISYLADYKRQFETLLMAPPYDIIIEVPGYSHSIITFRTLINVQSFAFQRFQISPDPLVTYDAVIKQAEAIIPSSQLNWKSFEQSIKIISNPCIRDFFLISMRTGFNDEDEKSNFSYPVRTYVQIPAHYTSGNDGCWTNITSIYCPNPAYAEECGEPEDLILTNRHFLILSSKGLLVSNDLIDSSILLSERYIAEPLARFDFVDPCHGIAKCFATLSNPMEEQLIYKRKLFYTPFCDVIQYPNDDDILIFALEHTDKGPYDHRINSETSGPLKTFSVTFAARPYRIWRPLFVRQEMFGDRYIMEIIGIFYNIHQERFDLTIKLSAPIRSSNSTNIHGKYVRFILPLPIEEPYITEGYPHLDGSWGKRTGFIVQNFTDTFIMNGMTVNPGTMDILYYGSELYIAESGRAIIYQSLGGFAGSGNTITGCHFNHPDRFYVCMLNQKISVLIGRVATWYGPVEVNLLSLQQIHELVNVLLVVGQKIDLQKRGRQDLTKFQREVLVYILERAFFTASFSGNIILWYFSDPKYLYNKILEQDSECTSPDNCVYYPPPTRPHITFNKSDSTCGHLSCADIPCILPVPLNPLKFRIQNSPTSGALVPFLIDSETCLLYEAFVVGRALSEEDYLSRVHIGQKIYCQPSKKIKLKKDELRTAHATCELYFRHIKQVLRKDKEGDNPVMPGFRSVTYTTMVKPIPMFPVSDSLKIQMAEDSNKVRIMCTDSSHRQIIRCKGISDTDIGVTLYIPGQFSILIQGHDWQIQNALIGIATHKTVLPLEILVDQHHSYRMHMRTTKHSQAQVNPNLFTKPHIPTNSTFGCNNNPPVPCHMNNNKTMSLNFNIQDWEIGDGGCQFEMNLIQNSYIKSSGGKIDLDLQDSVSFKVEQRPTSGLGKKMLYRPLMVVTQSNPDVLKVLTRFHRHSDRQTLSVLLKPTGIKQGVSSFVVRSIVSSISCTTPSSFTFIVQCVRAEGRRLQVKYPKTENVTEEHLIAPGKPIYLKPDVELYIVLPFNYRPPSQRGSGIPTTKNVYNVDPSKPLFNSWYKISIETAEFKSCKLQKEKSSCGCTTAQKLSDDPLYSDCKEKVYAVKRKESVTISLSYPPRQPDSEQLGEFFSPPPSITVKIEEINGRVDYQVFNKEGVNSPIVEKINRDPVLHMGDIYYMGTNLTFKLHGTGLYHFKATLGRYHTFDDVSGYIIIYSVSKDVDDVILVMLVVLTMTLCFVLIFFGFLRTRHRLVAQLPVRITSPVEGAA